MRAYDCNHVRGSGATRRRVTATAMVRRPRRSLERLAPVSDARLARLASGDERLRNDLVLWVYAAAIVGLLVLVAVGSLLGVVTGISVAAASVLAAATLVLATVLASRRFVVFATDDGPAGSGLDGLERCAGTLAASTGDLAPLGREASPARAALTEALTAARRRIDAAREAERAAATLDGDPTPLDVVALALAEARHLAAAHRTAAEEHLDAARDLLAAARTLAAARAREHLGVVGVGEGTGGWGAGPGSVVADEAELAVRDRTRRATGELTVRAEALAALG